MCFTVLNFLLNWCEEAGLGAPEPMPMIDKEWLAEEEQKLGS